ncbi:MAG TPA: O-antigen ligase family protein, partial [Candidatus Paceibacterota bacterium]
PFVPLVIASSLFFPFITGKAFVFRMLVEIAFGAYLILAIRDSSFRPKFSWILGSVLVFLCAIGLADILAINSSKAFWSNYERMEGLVTMLHLGAYFVVLGSVFKTQEIWNKLLATSVFASLIMAVYSLFQLAGKIPINQGGVRVDGTLGNASYLGIYMVFHIFFAALLFVRARAGWQKTLLAVSLLLNLFILYHTATRGAILGFVGGAFLSLIFLLIKSDKGAKLRKLALGGVIVLAVLAGLFFSLKNSSFVQSSPVLSRFSSLSFSEIKTQGRYYVWPMAMKGFVERPVFGWGQEGFNFVFNKYYDPRMYKQEAWFDRAHNTYLDWLVAGGLVGFISYLSIIVLLYFRILKAKEDFLNKEDKAIIIGVLSAYLFNNLFVFDQISSYILFFTIIAYVHAHTEEENHSLWEKISLKLKNVFEKEKLHPVLESSVLIILIAVLYFSVFSPWIQNKKLLEILRIANQGELASVDEYAKPLQNHGMGFPESLEHVSQTAIGVSLNPNASPELRQGLFDAVDKAFNVQLEKVPTDARYRLFYGLFLSRFGWYGRAIEQLEEAKKLSPQKQAIYFELASNYLLDNKPEKSLETAKVAYELEPSFDEAKLIYGFVATAAGNPSLGNQLFSEVDESKVVFDDRYMNVLISLGDSAKIIDIAKKRVSLDPQNSQHRITLAAAYLNANMRQEAIKAIEELIQIDPSFKEKGEYYISEIRAGRNP